MSSQHATEGSEVEVAVANGDVEVEGWRVRKAGSRYWASVSITPLWQDSGAARLWGFATLVHDDTERRRADRERLPLEMLEARDASRAKASET